MPERTEQPEVKNVKDMALLLNYYEHLVQEWESWGATAQNMISEQGQAAP